MLFGYVTRAFFFLLNEIFDSRLAKIFGFDHSHRNDV